MKPKIVIAVVVLLIVLVGLRVLLGGSGGMTDQQQIEAALNESIKASKEGRPGGVMDKLSSSLKVNEMDTTGNRGQIANYIKNNKPDVTIENKNAVVTGDEARIVSPVDISISMLGQSIPLHVREATFVFRKEEDHEYLVVPVTKWKLAEVEVPESVINEFSAG